MTTISVEAWSKTSVELSPAVAEAVAQSGLLTVLADQPPNRWVLAADSRVGVVHGDDWELRVVPKLAIPNLMFLLGYAADPNGWRDGVAAFEAEDELFAAVASGFAVHAERAISPAPLRGYVNIDDRGVTLRGRLRIADQLARWPALPVPLELSYDDHTADVPENRMVRGAAELLLRLPLVPTLARKRLLRVRATLDDVAPTAPDRGVEAPPITRLNGRYRAALALSELILRHTSISTRPGDLRSTSFVFDMNKVFEDFLSASLSKSLKRFGGHVQLQYGRENLDEERQIRLVPDITWWRRGTCLGVIDAKYKLVDNGFPNADAYQMLAYTTAFGLDRGYLVYAKDLGQEERRHRIRNTGAMIEVKAIDVERSPELLLAEVASLAAEITATAP